MLETFAVERGELLLGSVVPLDSILEPPYLGLQFVKGFFGLLETFSRLSRLVDKSLGLLVVLYFRLFRLFFLLLLASLLLAFRIVLASGVRRFLLVFRNIFLLRVTRWLERT